MKASNVKNQVFTDTLGWKQTEKDFTLSLLNSQCSYSIQDMMQVRDPSLTVCRKIKWNRFFS